LRTISIGQNIGTPSQNYWGPNQDSVWRQRMTRQTKLLVGWHDVMTLVLINRNRLYFQ